MNQTVIRARQHQFNERRPGRAQELGDYTRPRIQ